MCCHWLKDVFIRLSVSIYRGCHEYCEKGCITGSQYLVRPNYHVCERYVWLVIFALGSFMGFNLIAYYMTNFSQNVFRVVDEKHGNKQPFTYPSLGICETGVANDEQMLIRVEQALNSSLYKKFPDLRQNDELKHIVLMLTFSNLYEGGKFEKFLNYMKTLAPDLQQYLEHYDYKSLASYITSKCEELFVKCSWLQKSFDCCSVFRPIPTMMGNCFVFNSLQTEKTMAEEMVKQIEIFREPYGMHLTLSRSATFFISNIHDIPQTVIPFNSFGLKERGTFLSLELQITPVVNDYKISELDSDIAGCIQPIAAAANTNNVYTFESLTTCVTENFYQQQMNLCTCTDFNGPKTASNFCNLSQHLCLQANNFTNPRSWSSLAPACSITCDDSLLAVQNVFYSKPAEAEFREVFTVYLYLLNFPIKHKRRQVIRQSEDRLIAFGNILGLFMGVNVINAIELIYLICCAFWKYNAANV